MTKKLDNLATPKVSFMEYVSTVKSLDELATSAVLQDMYLEDMMDLALERGLSLETVLTGDIAQSTEPLGKVLKRKKPVYETAPNSKEAEDWILANKAKFKKTYGDDWKNVLYATAWKLFPEK